MPITFVSAGAGAAGADAVTVGLPAGVITGDLLILHIEGEGEDANADGAPPTGGWQLIGTVASAESGEVDRTRHTLYYTIYNSAAAPSLVVPDAGNHTIAIVTAWRGVGRVNPVHLSQSSSNGTNSTAISATGLTTTTEQCMIVISTSAGDDNGLAASVGFSNWANANLVSIAEAIEYGSDVGSDGSIGVAYGILAGQGATGATTADVGASEEEANWVLALKPAIRPTMSWTQ